MKKNYYSMAYLKTIAKLIIDPRRIASETIKKVGLIQRLCLEFLIISNKHFISQFTYVEYNIYKLLTATVDVEIRLL